MLEGTLVNFLNTKNRILASPQQPQGADDQMMAFTLVTTEKKFNTEKAVSLLSTVFNFPGLSQETQ